MNYSQIIKSISETILTSMKQSLSRAEFDKTFTANIDEKLSDNKATIQYNGMTYTVSSTVPFDEGDLVRICVPCNNWNDLFVVENRTANGLTGMKFNKHS